MVFTRAKTACVGNRTRIIKVTDLAFFLLKCNTHSFNQLSKVRYKRNTGGRGNSIAKPIYRKQQVPCQDCNPISELVIGPGNEAHLNPRVVGQHFLHRTPRSHRVRQLTNTWQSEKMRALEMDRRRDH